MQLSLFDDQNATRCVYSLLRTLQLGYPPYFCLTSSASASEDLEKSAFRQGKHLNLTLSPLLLTLLLAHQLAIGIAEDLLSFAE